MPLVQNISRVQAFEMSDAFLYKLTEVSLSPIGPFFVFAWKCISTEWLHKNVYSCIWTCLAKATVLLEFVHTSPFIELWIYGND